jgi:hypothetical protein
MTRFTPHYPMIGLKQKYTVEINKTQTDMTDHQTKYYFTKPNIISFPICGQL